MGKLFIFLGPIILLIGLGWLCFFVGKRFGEKLTINQVFRKYRLTPKTSQLVSDAAEIMHDLLDIDNIENDDIITDKTREELKSWIARYNKETRS